MTITILFLFIVGSLIYLQKIREGNWVNLISILMGPYFLIVLFNNLYVYKLGFYIISDDTLILLLSSFFMFYIGTLVANIRKTMYTEEKCRRMLENYNMAKMNLFLTIVAVVGLLKVLFAYRQGIFQTDFDEMEGYVTSGILGHLLFASFSVLPIYVLYCIEKKSYKLTIPVVAIFFVTFCGFIKYTIMGLLVSTFLFIAQYRVNLIKKSMILLLFFVVFFFFANYALGFAIAGSEVDPSFYLGHFWKYFSGSVIYCNYNFTSGISVGIDMGTKFMTFLCALPNMFLSIFAEPLFPYKLLPMLPVSNFGEESNVVDAVGYLFPSKADEIDIVLFYLLMCLIGSLFAFLYKKHNSIHKKYFDTFLSNLMCYFLFFSFFGTFYVNSAPWEILVWSMFFPNYFVKRKQIII